MFLLLEGVDEKRLEALIRSPGEVSDFLKANGREYKTILPTCFFLWEMEGKKVEDEGIEYTMIITDIPGTLNPETFVPTKTLPRNGFRSQRGLSEMILKSMYVSEENETIVLHFT